MVRELSAAIRETRRDRILSIAAEVMLSEGYAATTMSGISQRLGGSKATLYAYFPSKEDLLEAIILRQCESLFVALDQARGRPDIAERLRLFGVAFTRALVSDEGIGAFRLGLEACRDRPDLARRFEDVSIRVVVDQLMTLLELADTAGEIAAPDPALAATTFVTLMRGDLHFRRLLNLIPAPPPEVADREARIAVEIFLRAFAAPPKP